MCKVREGTYYMSICGGELDQKGRCIHSGTCSVFKDHRFDCPDCGYQLEPAGNENFLQCSSDSGCQKMWSIEAQISFSCPDCGRQLEETGEEGLFECSTERGCFKTWTRQELITVESDSLVEVG